MTNVEQPLADVLVFPRDLEPIDYLMFRSDGDPRARSGMLSMTMLDVTPDFERLQVVFERASRVSLRLRQHVVVPVLPISAAQWVIDPDFDLDFHVRRIRLPEPGTLRQLLDFSQLMLSAPFDAARPLWETYLVEGITEGEAPAALLMKTHHAVTDGVGGVELMRQLYDFDREADRGSMPPVPPPADVSGTDLTRRAARRAPISAVSGLVSTAYQGIRLSGRVVSDPGTAMSRVTKMLGSAQRVLGPPPVPPSPLFRGRGLGRRLEVLEFPLDHFRSAAKAAGGSVNDAYISAIGGGLRRYHEALGMMVDSVPLAMPVNLRKDDDPAGGNRFAGARIAAPVAEPDPARRIMQVRESVLSAVGEPAINALSAVAPVLSRLPTAFLGLLSGIATTTDVQASNLPGFPNEPYIAGAMVTKSFGFGPLPGVPMMIVLYTQAGMCYVGIHYDTAAITDHDLFIRCMREGFDEVLALDPQNHEAQR